MSSIIALVAPYTQPEFSAFAANFACAAQQGVEPHRNVLSVNVLREDSQYRYRFSVARSNFHSTFRRIGAYSHIDRRWGPSMDLSRERDEWLMSQVSLGKRDHLEPLVRRYASPLMTFIQKMIGNRHKSEDVFQEVFLAVWRKRSQYKFPRRFKSWLYGIAINKCRTQLRSQANPTSLPYQNCDPNWVQSPSQASPDHVLLSVEAAQHVVAGVALLPQMQRTVVVLRVWQSLPYSEIAEVLGKSTGTVRSHMHHGLANLRRYLEPRMR